MNRAATLPRSMFATRKPPRAGRPAWKCAEEFKRWLRKLPCARCSHPGDQVNPIVAAHVDHAGGKGTSTKVADRHCVPLCDDCHKQQHAMGWRSFEISLPTHDGVALAAAYWQQWPGRISWERELAEGAGR
jgi:5-methylcytosine-specific restriction endonuclease McrA